MENNVEKVYLEFSENEKFNNYVKKLKEELKDVSDSFIKIGGYLSELGKMNCYQSIGYNSYDQFCRQELNLDRHTVNRFIQVFERFGTYDENDKPSLQMKYQDFNKSQLIELVSVPDEEFDLFEPDMSIKEIRENKRSIELRKMLEKELDPSNAFGSIQLLIKYFLSTKFKALDYEFNCTVSNYKQIKTHNWQVDKDVMLWSFKITLSNPDLTIPNFELRVTAPYEYDDRFKFEFEKPNDLYCYDFPDIKPEDLFNNKFDSELKKQLTIAIQNKLCTKVESILNKKRDDDDKAKIEQIKLEVAEPMTYETVQKYLSEDDEHHTYMPGYCCENVVNTILDFLIKKEFLEKDKVCIKCDSKKGLYLLDLGFEFDLFGEKKRTLLCFSPSYSIAYTIFSLAVNLQKDELKFVTLNSSTLILALLGSCGKKPIQAIINASEFVEGTKANRLACINSDED